jgi:hypothetical protein
MIRSFLIIILINIAFVLLTLSHTYGQQQNDTITKIESDTIKASVSDSANYDQNDTLSVQEEIVVIDYVDESNKIVKPNIKTVLFHRKGWDMSPPLIKHDTGEKLKLSFDDLDGDVKEYLFTIIHCDADWKPSDLRKDEYIDGYYEDYIYDYSFSLNTIQPYTHYELIFPTADLAPILSGNYMLNVFVEHEDSVNFTRRFMVVEQKVEIDGKIKQ